MPRIGKVGKKRVSGTVKKRVVVTGSGKLATQAAARGHLLLQKGAHNKQNARKLRMLSKGYAKSTKRILASTSVS